MNPIPLIMLPGLDGTGKLFKGAIEYLPPFIEPVTVSYPPDEKLGYNDLVPLLLEKLPTEKPFVLLGESFGGPLSLLVADKRPARLSGIILCASFISCPHPLVPSWTSSLIPSAPFRLTAPISKLKGKKDGYWSEDSHKALASVQPKVWAHRLREVIGVNVSPELARTTTPLLYIQGKRDIVVPGVNLKKVRAIRADVQSVQINSTHMIMQTRPQQAAIAISRFIEQLPWKDDSATTDSA